MRFSSSQQVQSSSLTPGLQDLGSTTQTFTYSGTIPIGSILTTNFDLDFPRSDIISLIRVNVSGGNFGSYWIPIMGTAGIYDALSLSPFSGAYLIHMNIQSNPSGRRVNVQFVNETVGAPVTLPTLTFTFVAHMYAYPW